MRRGQSRPRKARGHVGGDKRSRLVSLVPKLLFGNARPRNSCFADSIPRGLIVPRRGGKLEPRRGMLSANREFRERRVPKQEFGNEGVNSPWMRRDQTRAAKRPGRMVPGRPFRAGLLLLLFLLL